MSVMGGLLAGNAPLRGRSAHELVVAPFDYRTAARFWGIESDPTLAVVIHSIVGGTPAHRAEFVADDVPASRDDFDDWVTRTVLNPAVPLFREARYLLAEETDIREPAAGGCRAHHQGGRSFPRAEIPLPDQRAARFTER